MDEVKYRIRNKIKTGVREADVRGGEVDGSGSWLCSMARCSINHFEHSGFII
jgi:hypothetical protein